LKTLRKPALVALLLALLSVPLSAQLGGGGSQIPPAVAE